MAKPSKKLKSGNKTLAGVENTAMLMASKQRDISVSEFFAKNRHLLGFDNPKRALLTVVKEAVDNSLDACEEGGILPEIGVEINDLGKDRFQIAVEDNGPGIVKKQISRIFARLLYGSKFHTLKMSRGQQGIGISAAVMYGQITTGKPAKIISKTSGGKLAYHCHLHINLQKNSPEILRDCEIPWNSKHGTRVEIELEAKYQKGKQSVDEYLRLTAIANPHLKLRYDLKLKKSPSEQAQDKLNGNDNADKANQIVYERATKEIPVHPKAIKPHPYGVELGILMRMLKETKARTLKSFLVSEFSRISSRTAEEICRMAEVNPAMKAVTAGRHQTENVYRAIQKVKITNPSTDCIEPIGTENVIAGLKREANAVFFEAVTRSPSVYRGNPFQIEVGVAYGGDNLPADELVSVMRFANRVPLLYQQSACVSFKSVLDTDWKNYALQQSRGALPVGPLILFVHMASVWVPFTSESKEAIAHYPEIMKEMRLALQELGRKLATHIRKKRKLADELKKRQYIEKYIPKIGDALKDILKLKDSDVRKTTKNLQHILEKSRKM